MTVWKRISSLLSAGSFETTLADSLSNVAVLFGITRRDGYRVDVSGVLVPDANLALS